MRIFYTGSFFGLLMPFALLAGLLSVSMLVAHGAAMLVLKTDGPVAERAARFGSIAAIIAFVLCGRRRLVAFGLPGYQITSQVVTDGATNPLLKTAELGAAGGWMRNYSTMPATILAPLLGLAGLLASGAAACPPRGLAFIASGAAIAGIILTVGFAIFPFLLPSSSQPTSSLTVGCLVQPPDPVDHAAGHGGVPADHPRLHHLGVPRAEGQDHHRRDGQQPERVLIACVPTNGRHLPGMKGLIMWYFAWILGAGLASTVAILNGMWFEAREQNRIEKENRR